MFVLVFCLVGLVSLVGWFVLLYISFGLFGLVRLVGWVV